ncbi:S1 family peptidase [Longispora urticae]
MRLLRIGFAAAAAAVILASTPGTSMAIVGGQYAPSAYSFMVSLQDPARTEAPHFCGGSLISANWVVTAWHCVAGKEPGAIRLRIGSRYTDTGGQVRTPTQIVTHPQGGAQANDVALIRLDRPVTNTPVKLDTRQPVGGDARLIGWGCTTVGTFCGDDGRTTTLKQLDTGFRDPALCTNVEAPINTANEICTGNPDTHQGACFGDSGGPLLRKVGGVWRLNGAFSRVEVLPQDPNGPVQFPDCSSGLGIYTDVTTHRTWIESVTGPLA